MLDKAKQSLNVADVIKEISTYCYSELTRIQLENPIFYTNAKALTEQRSVLQDLIYYLQTDEQLSIGNFEDIQPYLDALKPEFAIIQSEYILKIAHVIEITNRLLKVSSGLTDHEVLKSFLSDFNALDKTLKLIHRVISEQGSIKDNASSKLSSIRRSMRFIDSHIRTKTLELAKSKYKDYLIDSETTVRDGITVLAVKSEHVSLVNGTIHGYSNTGGTVFIGPEENTKKLRELNQLKSDELKELDTIMRELCGNLRQDLDAIRENFELLVELDQIHAKAQYAIKNGCILPELNTKDYQIKLKNAYHPILLQTMNRKEIVPLNIEFGIDDTIIIISGPNAGGKTVALKTVGLLCLMNQMCIPIPCDTASSLPIFHHIFCDIGDHQSINDDLSTFSSHIQNIKYFLDHSSIDTLILLDEMGTGTDPKEGSALSQSFIHQFLKNGAKVIATTHIGELKVFASETEGVQNASIPFDKEKLISTYTLKQNIPGQSYAFSIAQRFGIQKNVVTDARKRMSESDIKIENLIKELHDELAINEKLKKDLDLSLAKSKSVETMYESKLKKIKKYEKEVKDEAIKKADALLIDVNKRIEKTIFELRQSNADKKNIKKSKDVVHEMKEKVTNMKQKLKEKRVSDDVEFQIGDRVKHLQFQTVGEIIEINSGKYRLQMGNLTMHVDSDDIEFISRPDKKEQKQVVHIDHSISSQVKNEIDVRGKHFEEAWDACDEYLEMALSTGWEEIAIIHGKGSGILSQRINQQLKHDKRVLRKRFGKHGEGDTGVTIVTLRT
jgi:DNA mismatch repair protein MutS2